MKIENLPAQNLNTKKQVKIDKKDAKYFQKYGVHLDEVKKQNEKVKLKYVWKYLRYFKGYSPYFITLFIIAILILTLHTVWPLSVSAMTDSVVAQDWNNAFLFTLLFGVSSFGLVPLWLGFNYIANKVIFLAANKLRVDLINEVSKTKISKFNEVQTGEVLSRINRDPESFVSNFNQLLNNFMSVFRQFSRLVVIFVFSWKIGLAVLIIGLIIYLISNMYLKKYLYPSNVLNNKLNDIYDNHTTEMIKGIRDIKSLNISGHFFSKFKQISNFKRNAQNKNANAEANVDVAINNILFCFETILYIFAIYLIMNGEFTIGNFASLLLFDYDAICFFGSLASIKRKFFAMEVNAKRMDEIFDEKIYPKEQFGTLTLENAKGQIAFNNVDFAYKNEQVFQNLSLKINAGECVGFVGRSGEGKSTILNLIPRIFDVDNGQITLDNIDIRDLTCESLRETVSSVPQSPYIFNLSIAENLRLVKPDATQTELELACEKAAILDFIKSKPEGFDTIVGEGGVVLSGGQKQRLAIARAFLKDSKILLLDEATSALDNKSQEEIKKAIRNLQKSCTIVIVAHRLSTVSDCDKIFVLDNHKIVATGTHAQLLANCKVYQDLYKEEN